MNLGKQNNFPALILVNVFETTYIYVVQECLLPKLMFGQADNIKLNLVDNENVYVNIAIISQFNHKDED